MTDAMEQRRYMMRYVLPILGAVWAAIIMRRRARRWAGAEQSKEAMLLRQSNLDLHDAVSRALKYVPGTPVEVELGEEHGMPVWEVEIVPRKGGPNREVLVDAKTGDVLEMKAEIGEAPASGE
ncbi:MAG TPA: PepSY domain-containing protein [Armatimonadota bacterium]|nr:PepSY domain-containing protein [Armatimonadota bacterium]